MKDKLEVGMYVRTEEGKMFKTDGDKFYLSNDKKIFYRLLTRIPHDTVSYKVSKASHNIIDLIKHKDIILGKDGKLYQCWKVYKDYVFTYSKNKQGQTITLVDYQIDKVMCYEQFESMSYKLGDDK